MMLCGPPPSEDVEITAEPAETIATPSTSDPSRNWTLPEARAGATVAVNVTAWPTGTVVAEAERPVVVVWVPVGGGGGGGLPVDEASRRATPTKEPFWPSEAMPVATSPATTMLPS